MRYLFLCLAITISVTGCGASGSSDTLKIGMMPKITGISYFQASEQGAREAAKELGVELLYDGPTQDSVEDQIKMLNGWVAQGVDIIAVAPNDPVLISKTISDAQKDGAKVLTWDTDADAEKSGRQIFVNQAENEAIGNSLIDVMAEVVKSRGKKMEGKFLIVSGNPTAANQNAWMEVMKSKLKKEYPKVTLLEDLMPGEDAANALAQTQEVLNANADLVGIWGITSVSLPASARAVERAEKQNDIVVTGLALPRDMKPFVDKGVVDKFVLWSPVDLGYLTIHVARHISEIGAIKDGTYDFGRLKGIEVKNGQAILGPPLIFDKDNISNYDF